MGRFDTVLDCGCEHSEGAWFPCVEHFMQHRTKWGYPEVDFCSRCNDHADYYKQDGEWLSRCCDAPPVEVDPT